jgi:DNA-binding IclR family transcriptional regulator
MPIQSVERAANILFLFTPENPLLGINDISSRLGINQSTIHHLVQALMATGLLEQESNSKKYRLGLRTIELGGNMLRSRSLTVVVEPYLHHITDELNETAYLGVLQDGDLLNLAQICTRHLIQDCGWQGRRTPFHCTSVGKNLTAYLPEQEIRQLIEKKGLQRFTANTITDPDELMHEFELIREQGYALSFGELTEENNAVSVPIKSASKNNAIAALGVVGPSYRFTRKKSIEAIPFLKSIATDVSRSLIT